jgi:TIR domain
MVELLRAVFLSYASQDRAAAHRICEALRASGIEVWFDQSELRGGDIWDQRIRREWKLAIERTHDMAEQQHFLVPVVVDGTGDKDAIVPELFRAVQWTRLPQGETPPAFLERVKRLLSPEAPTPIRSPASLWRVERMG